MTDCRAVEAKCRPRGLGQYGGQDWGTATPESTAPTWWQNLLSGAFGTAEQAIIAKTQTRGILTQTAPGQFTYVQPEGSQVTLPVNVSPAVGVGGQLGVSTSPGMGLVLVGGVALLVVVMLARKG